MSFFLFLSFLSQSFYLYRDNSYLYYFYICSYLYHSYLLSFLCLSFLSLSLSHLCHTYLYHTYSKAHVRRLSCSQALPVPALPWILHQMESGLFMNSMKIVIPLLFISWKKTPNGAVTPQRQSQFTPKMKANAVPRLLSSLVWIYQYNECDRMTSFIEFTLFSLLPRF